MIAGNNIYRWLTLICILFALLSCRETPAEAPSDVLLKVDDRILTVQEFQRSFKRSLPADQPLSDDEQDELKRSFLVQAIDHLLMVQEARRRGLTVSVAEVDAALQDFRQDYSDPAFERLLRESGTTLQQWRSDLEDGLLIEKVIEEAVYAQILVPEEEIATYYHEHREEFDRPQQVRARQIVVANKADGEKVLGLLRSGQPFAEIAKQYSLSPDSEDGGDLGYFASGEMPQEFDAVVFKLPVGRLSDLVKSDYGYHIFLVDEIRPAVRLTLDEARDEIIHILRVDKEEKAYQVWLQDLRTRANIEVDWDLL